MNFQLLSDNLLNEFTQKLKQSPLEKLDNIKKIELPVDYFQFYKSVSSVYSSKIEGEDIEFDSFFKHKFLNVEFKPDYTKKADDLFSAYDFIDEHSISLKNIQEAHRILSDSLLPTSHQGAIRSNPMFVINSNDQIEYVACDPKMVKTEFDKLLADIQLLQSKELNDFEVFYYAAFIHLMFVKIHPFQDGNGRTGRLLEKWFLIEKLGAKAAAIQLEKNYFTKVDRYYANLKKLGLDYELLDFNKSLDFLLMTANSIDN
jgi:Fic family protein